MQQQVGTDVTAETVDSRGVNGDAKGKGALQLAGHNGHIVLLAVNIAECQTDEFHFLLLHKLHHFFR